MCSVPIHMCIMLIQHVPMQHMQSSSLTEMKHKKTFPCHNTTSNTNEIDPMTHTWIHSIKELWMYPGACAHYTPARIATSRPHSTASAYQ
jgi:hypothetical protein